MGVQSMVGELRSPWCNQKWRKKKEWPCILCPFASKPQKAQRSSFILSCSNGQELSKPWGINNSLSCTEKSRGCGLERVSLSLEFLKMEESTWYKTPKCTPISVFLYFLIYIPQDTRKWGQVPFIWGKTKELKSSVHSLGSQSQWWGCFLSSVPVLWVSFSLVSWIALLFRMAQHSSSSRIWMVFPVVMYGCESWTIKKAERWRIGAFELCWRRLLRVLWTTRRSNQSFLKGINLE